MSEFTEWDSFYVIVGSAAGALIGLQFVVMTLIAERPPKHAADAGCFILECHWWGRRCPDCEAITTPAPPAAMTLARRTLVFVGGDLDNRDGIPKMARTNRRVRASATETRCSRKVGIASA
jgi:hypothetical protein